MRVETMMDQRERYNEGHTTEERAGRNKEVFKSILMSQELAENKEVPLFTVAKMYPMYEGMEYRMTEDELILRAKLLENAKLISMRQSSYGNQMVSITEYGYKRYYSSERVKSIVAPSGNVSYM